ncbi:MAG: hypothetical protein JXP39_02975 [Spirochaetales bacterium]|nr:hypothetical protein [Spirochaetales bacterium]
MNFGEYRELLLGRLASYFDIVDASIPVLSRWETAARHSSTLNQTFLGKTNVVDSMESAEWCLIRSAEAFTRQTLAGEAAALDLLAKETVSPSRNHKSSLFVSVVAVPSLDADEPETRAALRSLRAFRKSTPHKWYFHGWTELAVAVVDLSTGTVRASPGAKRMAANLLAIKGKK